MLIAAAVGDTIAFTTTNEIKKVNKLEKLQTSLQKDMARRFEHIVGESEPIQTLQSILLKVAPTDANILILGENGTGKQVFAESQGCCLHLRYEPA